MKNWEGKTGKRIGSLNFEKEEKKVWRYCQEITKVNSNSVGKILFTNYFLVLMGLLWKDGKP